jgi:hypothetical protein
MEVLPEMTVTVLDPSAAARPADCRSAGRTDRAAAQGQARPEQELAKARFVVHVQSKPQALFETISDGADTGNWKGS